jgi:APA family basic amino acid/polyamine antiporter
VRIRRLEFDRAILNLPAMLIVAAADTILVIGIRESARINNLIVMLKVSIILLIVLYGLQHINTDNWKP